MKQPEIVWANAINLSGLYSKEPIRCRLDDVLDNWWDRKGEFSVNVLGTHDTGGMIYFSSEVRNDVVFWTEGAKAVMKMLNEWSK